MIPMETGPRASIRHHEKMGLKVVPNISTHETQPRCEAKLASHSSRETASWSALRELSLVSFLSFWR